MAVKIRLKRLGKIRAPYYRIVVADSRTKRDGRVIEEIGKYHPTEEPSYIEIDSARAQYWLGVGAQPTEQVAALLKLSGDWGIFKGEKGAKSTIRTKEAPIPFSIDEKKKPVLKPKAEPKADAKPAKAAKEEAAPAADAEVVEDTAAIVATEGDVVEPESAEVVEALADEAPAGEAPLDVAEEVAAESAELPVAETVAEEPADAPLEVEVAESVDPETVAEVEAAADADKA